jgi:hypothetical protein
VSPDSSFDQTDELILKIVNPKLNPDLPPARSRTLLQPRPPVPREQLPPTPTRSDAVAMLARPRRRPKSSTQRWLITLSMPTTLRLLVVLLPLLLPTEMPPWRMRLW